MVFEGYCTGESVLAGEPEEPLEAQSPRCNRGSFADEWFDSVVLDDPGFVEGCVEILYPESGWVGGAWLFLDFAPGAGLGDGIDWCSAVRFRPGTDEKFASDVVFFAVSSRLAGPGPGTDSD